MKGGLNVTKGKKGNCLPFYKITQVEEDLVCKKKPEHVIPAPLMQNVRLSHAGQVIVVVKAMFYAVNAITMVIAYHVQQTPILI
tara:strand:- start:120 stop:371 length:252 start_codon:yes stop_codon:yes gene_type:complete